MRHRKPSYVSTESDKHSSVVDGSESAEKTQKPKKRETVLYAGYKFPAKSSAATRSSTPSPSVDSTCVDSTDGSANITTPTKSPDQKPSIFFRRSTSEYNKRRDRREKSRQMLRKLSSLMHRNEHHHQILVDADSDQDKSIDEPLPVQDLFLEIEQNLKALDEDVPPPVSRSSTPISHDHVVPKEQDQNVQELHAKTVVRVLVDEEELPKKKNSQRSAHSSSGSISSLSNDSYGCTTCRCGPHNEALKLNAKLRKNKKKESSDLLGGCFDSLVDTFELIFEAFDKCKDSEDVGHNDAHSTSSKLDYVISLD